MAPPPEPPTSIAIRVKVPPGHVPGGADEFTLGTDIPVASKIGQIRERIQEAIPSSPTPERQRLLYGGRALVDNDQTVADALNIRRDPTQTEYVIHLLVKGEGTNTAPVPHRTGMRTPGRSASPAAATRPATVPPAPATQQTAQNAPNAHAPLPHQLTPHAAHQHHMQQHAIVAQAQRMMMQNQHLLHHQPMMPFPMQQFPGHMHGMQFPQQNGMPMQQFPGQGQQNPMQANSEQNANETQQSNPTQQPTAQGQESQSNNQPNDGQSTIQLPPRVSTQQNGNGQDVQVRIQQTLRYPPATLLAQQRHFGMPPQMHPPGVPSTQPNSHAPSALDRARENVAEMQRMLNEMRNANSISEAEQAQIRSLEERTRNLSDYIDPFRVGSNANNQARSNSPAPNIHIPPAMRMPQIPRFDPQNWQQRAHQIRQMQHPSSNSNPADVTCFLLSSPSGPHAIIYSPQHGTYTGQMPLNGTGTGPAGLTPTPTTNQTSNNATAGNGQEQPNQAAVQGQAEGGQQVQAQAQAQAAQQDPLGPLGPILGHLWLLLRVLIFSYFLLGANMGWRRPLALFAIGMGFWMIRMGLLGDGGALRRWWDGIMNDGRPPPAQQGGQQDQNQQQQQQQQQGEQQGQQPAGNARPGQMPTPEQLAQRLLDEDARARNQARDQRLQWIRERIRPVERAVALLVASLWPGVGEAYVRAIEQEERRRAEEEIAARRREEEERQKKEEEEKQKNEGDSNDEKATAPAEAESTASGAGQDTAHKKATEGEKAGSAA